LADGPVCCERFSAENFPVKQGNNREVCSFRSIFAALESDNAAETLGFFIKFPEKKNRELFFMIKEISKGDQGILGACREAIW
jgi:hypothetical protein